MLWLVLGVLAVGWAGDPVNTLSPAYADLFGLDETFVGLQVGAFGTGAAIASTQVGRLVGKFGYERTTQGGMVVLAAGLIGFSLAPAPWVVIVALFIAGQGFVLGVAATNANLQQRLDESMRGRVMALWSMAFLGSRPLAAIVDGGIADLVSPRAGVASAVVPLLAGFWAMGRVRPHEVDR